MDNSKLDWEKAIELLKNGQKVLQTDISSKITISLHLAKDVKDWIKKENVDIDKLVSQLMTNFYHTIKNI